MAKKASSERTGPYKEARRPIRLHVTEEEYHLIRMRAAESHLSMSEFCRRSSVGQSKKGPLPLDGTEEAAPKRRGGNK